jgi:hypothetical protein
MAKPGKDDVLKDLIEFFLEELDNNPKEIQDWLIQGDWDAIEFVEAVRKLRAEIAAAIRSARSDNK